MIRRNMTKPQKEHRTEVAGTAFRGIGLPRAGLTARLSELGSFRLESQDSGGVSEGATHG